MKSSITVTRAILAEFARRIYLPILIVAIILAAVLLIGSLLLTTLSTWWWILAVVVILAICISATIFLLGYAVISLVKPAQTKSQRSAVKEFVDKLQGLSEVTQTPKVILLFRVIRDAVSSREDGFVLTTIGHTLSLRKDFQNLRQLFE